jgi:cation-transporting ATPase E
MGVVFFNMAVGIVQEVRAKRMVDRLTILPYKQVRVMRNGVQVSCP